MTNPSPSNDPSFERRWFRTLDLAVNSNGTTSMRSLENLLRQSYETLHKLSTAHPLGKKDIDNAYKGPSAVRLATRLEKSVSQVEIVRKNISTALDVVTSLRKSAEESNKALRELHAGWNASKGDRHTQVRLATQAKTIHESFERQLKSVEAVLNSLKTPAGLKLPKNPPKQQRPSGQTVAIVHERNTALIDGLLTDAKGGVRDHLLDVRNRVNSINSLLPVDRHLHLTRVSPENIGPMGGIPEVPPHEVAKWWGSLTHSQQDLLTRQAPATIGNLDGIPLEVRADANILRMQQLLDSDPPGGKYHKMFADFIRREKGRLVINPERRFVLFDESGDGRIAEAFGLPMEENGRTKRVAVMVPGTGTTPGSLGPEGKKQAGEGARIATAGDDNLVVIRWIGCDFPDNVAEATKRKYSLEGAYHLKNFVEGLQAEGADAVTLFGHSYGSTIIGDALKMGARVETVVAVGSPGMGVHDIADFPKGSFKNFYAGAFHNDAVSLSEWHGNRPTDGDFGALVFDVGVSDKAWSHSDYLIKGSTSEANIIAIFKGEQPRIPSAHERDSQAREQWLDTIQDVGDFIVDATPAGQAADAITSGINSGIKTAERGIDAVTFWN